MKRQFAALLSLALCVPAVAEPVMYVCERPTWGSHEGCGPNNTRYTYAFLIDDEDYGPERSVSYEDEVTRPYAYTETKGCDLSRATGQTGNYLRTDKGFIFGMDYGREVELHTDPMQAKLLGAAVRHSPYMNCTVYTGDAVQEPTLHNAPPFWQPTHRVQRPTSPTNNLNSDYSRQ